MKLAVLITVHNRIEKTLRCLHCLKEAVGKLDMPVDVYLVDDASTDGTAEKIRGLFPEVVIIPGNGKLFWNRGMRLAWETAANHGNYDYYLWLNNDTYVFPNALKQLLQHSARKEDQSIIVGKTISETTGLETYGAETTKPIGILYDDDLGECDLINGNCVLVPRFVYESVGLLDRVYVHALGDRDYSLRAKHLGINSYLSKAPLAYCECDTSSTKWLQSGVSFKERLVNFYSPLGYTEPLPYFRFNLRHFGLLTALRHFLIIHIRFILRIPQRKLNPNLKED